MIYSFLKVVILYILYIIIERANVIKVAYDRRLLQFDETQWRPDAFLSWMVAGLPSGNNALATMVPNLPANSVVLTQVIFNIVKHIVY